MVTTRRQSKDSEPAELPAAVHRKRKRSNNASPTPTTTTAQPPNLSSTKRRKKVKSTAKTSAASASVHTAPSVQQAAPSEDHSATTKHAERRAPKQTAQATNIAQRKVNATHNSSMQNSAEAGFSIESDSSDDAPPRRPQPTASLDADEDDEDADSRYALGLRREKKARKLTAPAAQRTAELRFEEDGLEEIDKANVAIANTNWKAARTDKGIRSLPQNSGSAANTGSKATDQTSEQKRGGKGKTAQKKTALFPGTPSRLTMFTIAEAIAALSLYKDGTMSVSVEIDPQTRQPYEPLQAGEIPSYPVKSTYHLGALGRFGVSTVPRLPFSLTVPLSEHSFFQDTSSASTAEPLRRGLGFESALTAQSRAPAVRRPNNYCFTFGKFRGRRMDSVPISYLRSIFNSDEYHSDMKLQQAFIDLYPKGLYESEAESYTFEKGGFKGKRLDEVPKSYLWGLLRKMNEGAAVGGKKGRGRLERALEVWEKGQLDLTRD